MFQNDLTKERSSQLLLRNTTGCSMHHRFRLNKRFEEAERSPGVASQLHAPRVNVSYANYG